MLRVLGHRRIRAAAWTARRWVGSEADGGVLPATTEGLKAMAEAAVRAAQGQIAALSRGEAGKGVGAIGATDTLSDTLCRAVDWLAIVGATHPDKATAAGAAQMNNELMTLLYHLNTHAGLYAAIAAVTHNPPAMAALTPEQARTGQLLSDEFERHGVHLDAADADKLRHILNDGFSLSTQYMARLEEGQSSGEIAGALRAVLSATDDATRASAYAAYVSVLPDNVAVLENLLAVRHAQAKLLGKASYAHFTGEEKMVKEPAAVVKRLDRVLDRMAPAVDDNIRALLQRKLDAEGPSDATAVLSRPGPATISGADLLYYNQLVKADAAALADPISPYLSLRAGLAGVALAAKELFGLCLVPSVPKAGETLALTVLKYEVQTEAGAPVGTIFVDPWPRPGKQGGAVHLNIKSGRSLLDPTAVDAGSPFLDVADASVPGEYQAPSVLLVFNFRHRGPNNDLSASLLSLAEFRTLFHEFGHGLHSMLARTQFHHVAGTRVPLDFVEFPSSFFQKLAHEWPVVSAVCKHYQTGAPLPRRLFDAHVASLRAGAVLDELEQIELAAIDTQLHTALAEPGATAAPGWSSAVTAAATARSPIVYPDSAARQARFGHLVTYGSSYYSYSLCEALAAEAWDALSMSDGCLDRARGMAFARAALVHGNAVDPADQVAAVLAAGSRFAA